MPNCVVRLRFLKCLSAFPLGALLVTSSVSHAEEAVGPIAAEIASSTVGAFVKRASQDPLQDIKQAADKVAIGLRSLPFADKSPIITDINPKYIISNTPSSEIIATFDGFNLSYGEPKLYFDNNPCRLGTLSTTSIQFLCDRNIFQSNSRFLPRIGSLVVRDYEDFWRKLKAQFADYAPQKTFSVLVMAAPPKMGDFRVEATYKVYEQQFAEQSGQIEARNQHCEGGREHGPYNFSVLGGPEWSIVGGSIRAGGEMTGNQERDLRGPFDVTSQGFRYMVWLRNGGQCRRVCTFGIGCIGEHDKRAWKRQEIFWKEMRTVARSETREIGAGELSWGSDVVLAMPEDLESYRVLISQIDGSQQIVVSEDNSRLWFRVSVDQSGRQLLIRPRSIEEVLQ
jgi:hypothetical protein